MTDPLAAPPPDLPHIAYLGLGSNLGDREAFIDQALIRLQGPRLSVQQVSSLYESAPVGPVPDQPDFLNAVAQVWTSLDPQALLQRCLEVEIALGRQRQVPQGPRTIDLDLILVDGLVLGEPNLTLPHPQMNHRAFVLLPLLEIAPQLRDPRDNQPLWKRAAELLPGQSAKRIKSLH